jgi:hypothetical protein
MPRAIDSSPKWITPGLQEHMEATGEQPPNQKAWLQAVDMEAHGGYVVRKAGKVLSGPYAWVENARREAQKAGGVVALAKNMRVVRDAVKDWRPGRRASTAGNAHSQAVKISNICSAANRTPKAVLLARLRAKAIKPHELARATGQDVRALVFFPDVGEGI